jgi:hypothetical protein
MFTSKYRDDLGIVFIVDNDAGPPQVDLPDDDLRPQIRVPSSNTESWDEAACRDAFHALAEVTKDSSINIYQRFHPINIYREFAVFLPSIKVTYEEFDPGSEAEVIPRQPFGTRTRLIAIWGGLLPRDR